MDKNEEVDYMKTIEKLNIITAEYGFLRQSLLSFFQIQITILTIGVGLVSGLIIYGLVELPKLKVPCYPQISTALFCAIIPGAYAFLSVIWFDFTHRQVETGAYLSILEQKMGIIARNEDCFTIKNPSYTFMWEHWNKVQFKSKFLLKQSNQIYYYVCFGLFLALPVAAVLLWLFCTNPSHGVITAIGFLLFLIIYILMIVLACIYISAIQSFKKKIISCDLDLYEVSIHNLSIHSKTKEKIRAKGRTSS